MGPTGKGEEGMILRDKWLWVKQAKTEKTSIVLPQGVKPTIDAETEAFEVMQIGGGVEDVRVGDIVILIAALGSLMRWKYKEEVYLATLEGDVIAIMNRTQQHNKPMNERKV